MNREKIFIIFVVISTTLILWLFSVKSDLKTEIKNTSKEVLNIKKEGVSLSDLRDRWEDKRDSKKDLNQLLTYKKRPDKRERSNKTTLIYSSLDKKELDYVLAKALRSNLIFLSIDIKQIDEFTAELKLEIQN